MIEVKNLSYAYSKDDIALRDVSFTVNDGEWVSIIGHNGSGKSTLAKLLIGLIDPNVGNIYYDGVLLDESNKDQIRKKVGIVFQNPDNQFVGFNVKYDIAFGLENHQVERNEMIRLINESLIKVDMLKYLEREPQTLSGGQKQRVAIAGILALDSDVIILDEATSMLDPEGQNDIKNIILELKNKYHKTLITITHDLSLCSESDRIILLKNGRLLMDDKPENIFKERDLLVSSNLDMPFAKKAYYLATMNEKINNNKELMESLWEYYSKM